MSKGEATDNRDNQKRLAFGSLVENEIDEDKVRTFGEWVLEDD